MSFEEVCTTLTHNNKVVIVLCIFSNAGIELITLPAPPLTKNAFDLIVFIIPVLYRIWHYYNQKCNLSQAYDIAINGLDEPRELPAPTINLNKMEVIAGYNVVEEVKSVTKKDKVVVIQPFGRSITQLGEFMADASSRSMSLVGACEIINQLKKDYAVIIMSEYSFPVEENEESNKHQVARPQIQDMRVWSAVIDVADHFIGCDSMGQHIARALGKTATVVVGSTYPENISYPGHKDFDIIDVGDGRREYAPIRITQDETVDRFNDEAMELSKNQIKEIVDSCKKRLGKPKAYTGTFVPPQQEQQTCDMPMSQPPKQDAFQLSGGSQMTPSSMSIPPMTGAPKPSFTLNKPKPKKGFKQEIKNLLKSDGKGIKIEEK